MAVETRTTDERLDILERAVKQSHQHLCGEIKALRDAMNERLDQLESKIDTRLDRIEGKIDRL
ncbi:MAG: hypothetical protein OXG11_13185 [Chloroflexi bacterium]|nr:hypothetical protein [Chloroflexota bacterium]